jgi:hypothetical protein
VNVVGHNLQGDDQAIKFFRLFLQEPPQVLLDGSRQYRLSPLRYPDKVIINQANARIKVSILLTHQRKPDVRSGLASIFQIQTIHQRIAPLDSSALMRAFDCKRLKHLHSTIDVSSEIWNHSVALKNRYYKLFGKGLTEGKLKAHLAKLRNQRFPHWKTVGSQSVQAIVERLYLGWEAFFKGDIKRPPTFCKRRKYRSFTLKQAGYKLAGHGRIKILGRAYRCNQSRAITGLVKTVNVRRDAHRDVYVTFSCANPREPISG